MHTFEKNASGSYFCLILPRDFSSGLIWIITVFGLVPFFLRIKSGVALFKSPRMSESCWISCDVM